jgi:CSLREA domain-containing protein
MLGSQAAKPAQASGTTFIVNSTNDPGDGTCNATEYTLREAITAANRTSAADTIKFDIPGSGVQTISPGSALPVITHPVTIDGYSQSGAKENDIPLAKDGTDAVLMIELDGTNAGIGSDGLNFGASGASNSVVRGLVINHFSAAGILLSGGTGYKVEGNFIGTDPSGTAAEGNTLPGMTMVASNSIIGDASPATRNLISSNEDGIIVGGGGGNKIEGNLIGTKADGTSALGNIYHGVLIDSSSNTIGDSDPSDGATNAANVIAFNPESGVGIYSATGATSIGNTGNRILSNSIYSNGKLGIDLGDDGVTANDDKDPDTGPNNLQNYPDITSAQVFHDAITHSYTTFINATLNSTPSTKKKKRTFITQFFSSPEADSSGYGEGKTFLGQIEKKTDKEGNTGPFTFSVSGDLSNQYVTATATNKKTGDTSEFSNAKVVTPPF